MIESKQCIALPTAGQNWTMLIENHTCTLQFEQVELYQYIIFVIALFEVSI